MSEQIKVNVVVNDDSMGEALPSMVAKLKAHGLHVTSTLDKLGIVSGSISQDKLADLRAIKGVREVQPEREMVIVRPVPPQE